MVDSWYILTFFFCEFHDRKDTNGHGKISSGSLVDERNNKEFHQ